MRKPRDAAWDRCSKAAGLFCVVSAALGLAGCYSAAYYDTRVVSPYQSATMPAIPPKGTIYRQPSSGVIYPSDDGVATPAQGASVAGAPGYYGYYVAPGYYGYPYRYPYAYPYAYPYGYSGGRFGFGFGYPGYSGGGFSFRFRSR